MRPTRSLPLLSLCLLLMAALPAWLTPAAAQQQEKRIALVVGDGAYANAPLATTANDAGLIAQTLQAAGFDVIGARDLDGDTLRKSFHDFIQKVQAAGSNTVAMVYLSGYAMQLGGENYFIPVDASISRATDIPIEGLRISDYMRELASLPLKAGIFVLDAAHQQPFIQGSAQIASGLALVAAPDNMLIAFNAAPGTVAPTEKGPYGVYAQSLAEMIRTGGLSLPDVFNRVRLRVNETSKGAQVPWDAQKIHAQFAFFDRAPNAPALQGPPDQVAAIRDRPMRDLSVQDAYTAALDRDTLRGYEDFLAAYPRDPLARRVRAIIAARREAITWRRAYLDDTPDSYWSYLRRYPHGPHAWDARRRLAILSAALEPPPSFAVVDFDVPPPPPDELVYVDRPVLYFGDPEFDFAPPPPPPVFFLPPPPPDFVVLPPPFVAIGLFILPQPVFVPIPVYCRPPVYVAPPPHDIIFNNIHNTTVINNVINRPPPVTTAARGTSAAAAAAAAGRPVGAGPALPRAVVQRASLIQHGRASVPPSARIIPAARPGSPRTTPTHVRPTTTPKSPPSALSRTHALPVPGSKGVPPPPREFPGAGHAHANPRAKVAPTPSKPGQPKRAGTATRPTGSPPVQRRPSAQARGKRNALPAARPERRSPRPRSQRRTQQLARPRPVSPRPQVRTPPVRMSRPASPPRPMVRRAPPARPTMRPAPPPRPMARPAPHPMARPAAPPRRAAPAKKCPHGGRC
ncbi:MAG: caspase family protein [Bradyrhizobium sp.]